MLDMEATVADGRGATADGVQGGLSFSENAFLWWRFPMVDLRDGATGRVIRPRLSDDEGAAAGRGVGEFLDRLGDDPIVLTFTWEAPDDDRIPDH